MASPRGAYIRSALMECSAWLIPRPKPTAANTIMRISYASLRLLLLASRAFVRPANNLGVAVSRATPIPHFAALKGPGSCLAYYIVG